MCAVLCEWMRHMPQYGAASGMHSRHMPHHGAAFAKTTTAL
jgi:hypothetical protein